MANASCCNSEVRNDSPDAPGARQPFIEPAPRRLLPRSPVPENQNASGSLTHSDICELRNNVPSPASLDSSGERPPCSQPTQSRLNRFVSRIKQRLSKDKLFSRVPRVKQRLRLFSESHKPKTVLHRSLDISRENVVTANPDLLVGYDSDAQPLTDEDVVDCLTPGFLSRPSCSQPSGTCATESVEINRTSASTRLATESQTSQSDPCTQNLDHSGTVCAASTDHTLSSSSRLGSFPFEHRWESHRGRQLSRDSDIALAAEELFDSLCSRSSYRISAEIQESRAFTKTPDSERKSLREKPKGMILPSMEEDANYQKGRPTASVFQPGSATKSASRTVEDTKSNEQSVCRGDGMPSTCPLRLSDMRISQHLRSMSDQSEHSFAYESRSKCEESDAVSRNAMGGASRTALGPQREITSRIYPSPVAMPGKLGNAARSLQPEFPISHPVSHDSAVTLQKPVHLPKQSETAVGDLTSVRSSISTSPRNTNPVSYPNIANDAGTPSENEGFATKRSGIWNGLKIGYDRMRILYPSKSSPICSKDISPGTDSTDENSRPKPHPRDSKDSRFDGPADNRSNQAPPIIAVVPPEGESVARNYEETTALWEKALRTHQEDQLNPQRKRDSSLSSASRKSSRHSRQSSETSDKRRESFLDPEPRRSSSRASSITLKRVDTSHSFDLIRSPGKDTFMQTVPEGNEAGQRNSLPVLAHRRVRSISQPHPARRPAPRASWDSSRLTVPVSQSYGDYAPNDSLEDNVTDTGSPPIAVSPGPKLLTELGAWGRYPSHTRKERNGSAGPADNVIVRDFGAVVDASGDDSNRIARMKKGWFLSKNSKLRIRTKIFQGKYLTELSSIFKDRGATSFRRRQHGHRTSLTMGGVLEYPELELLPLREPPVQPERKVPAVVPPQSAHREPRISGDTRDATQAESSRNKLLPVTSSEYGSSPTQNQDVAIPEDARIVGNDWVDMYRQCVPGQTERQGAQSSSLDGTYGDYPFSRPASVDISSQPIIQQGDGSADLYSMQTLESTRAMRSSTQDLCRMLDEGESVEMARALRAAEEAFKD